MHDCRVKVDVPNATTKENFKKYKNSMRVKQKKTNHNDNNNQTEKVWKHGLAVRLLGRMQKTGLQFPAHTSGGSQ